MEKYFKMERFVTPNTLMVLHIIWIFVCLGGMLYLIGMGIGDNSVLMALAGLFLVPLVYLLGRIWMELTVVLFKIYDELKK